MTDFEKNILGLRDYEIHYLNQGLHFEIEKYDETDATQIVKILRDETQDKYIKKKYHWSYS